MSVIIKGRDIVLRDYAQITDTIGGSSKKIDVFWYLEKVNKAVYPYDEYHPVDYILSVYSHILDYAAGSSYPMDRMFFFMIHNKDYKFYSNPENVKTVTKLTNVITNTPIYSVNSNSNIRFSGCTTFKAIAEKTGVSEYEKFNGIPESKYKDIMDVIGPVCSNTLIVDTPHIQTAVGNAVTTLSNDCYLFSETDQITIKLKYEDGEIIIPTYVGGFDITGEVGVPKYVTTTPSLKYYSWNNIPNYVDITEYPQANLDEIKSILNNLKYYELTSGEDMFSSANPVTNIIYKTPNFQTLDLNSLDVSKIYSISNIFCGCTKLTSINLSNWNTSNVTNMDHAFYDCSGLTTLDLSNFDTSNVTSMRSIFNYCNKLTTLNISNFNTSKVTDMESMFECCSGLTTLDVSKWDTSKVTNMKHMFFNCNGLTTLDVSNFNTSKVTYMEGMFENCSSLTTLDVSKWDTSKVTRMDNMFTDCNNLTTLDVSKWDTSNVTNMRFMFYRCKNLTALNISNFNTSKVTEMEYMFDGCSSLAILDVSNFNTSNVTNMDSMFENCSSLTTLDVSKWDTSKVTNMKSMFENCSGLTTLDVSKWDTSNVTAFGVSIDIDNGGMFENCGITSLDLSKWDTSKGKYMAFMFYGCTALTNLVLNFDMSSITDIKEVRHMFDACKIASGSIVFNNVKTSVFIDRATFINAISGSGISDSILTVNFV